MLKGARASARPATVAGGRLVASTRRAVCRRDAVDRPSDTRTNGPRRHLTPPRQTSKRTGASGCSRRTELEALDGPHA
jgi:hypothetical protein